MDGRAVEILRGFAGRRQDYAVGLESRGKNILSCESALEIRGFGWLVRWDDEFQINGLWLRQASRCKV